MSKRRIRVQKPKPKLVKGNGNKARVERVQELRRSGAAGVHGTTRPRQRMSVREILSVDADTMLDM